MDEAWKMCKMSLPAYGVAVNISHNCCMCPKHIYVLAYCWNISYLDYAIIAADIQQASNSAVQC